MATWRSGYAADCKSPSFPSNSNVEPQKRYQDKAETLDEPDNAVASDPSGRNENAAPTGIGSGVKAVQEAIDFQSKPYHHPDRVAIRKVRAAQERMLRALFGFNGLEASEQRLFVERVAEHFTAGEPVPAFEHDRLQSEAEGWVRWACNGELEAYALAIEDELFRRARAGKNELRRVFASLWNRLSTAEQAAFLSHVSKGGAA